MMMTKPRLPRRGIRKSLLCCALCALAAGGCRSTQPVAPAGVPLPGLTEDILIAMGDEIEVKFFYNPELNEIQKVRPDGKITLQLIGDVDAAGKSPVELKFVLSKLAEVLLENPEVAVFVRSQIHRVVYVGGAVNSPRAVEIPGRMEALSAIMSAGGFDRRTAHAGNVIVIRHQGGKRYGCALDFRPALRGEESVPFYLQPEDIVYVPQTTIANVNRWIDQHINKIIPQLGLIYSKSVGSDGTLTIDTSRDFFF